MATMKMQTVLMVGLLICGIYCASIVATTNNENSKYQKVINNWVEFAETWNKERICTREEIEKLYTSEPTWQFAQFSHVGMDNVINCCNFWQTFIDGKFNIKQFHAIDQTLYITFTYSGACLNNNDKTISIDVVGKAIINETNDKLESIRYYGDFAPFLSQCEDTNMHLLNELNSDSDVVN